MRRIVMIKNLTQVFLLGILSGVLMTGLTWASFAIGDYYIWVGLFAVVYFLTALFYDKLERCQHDPTDEA